MKRILLLFILLVIGAFLLGCTPQSAEDKSAAGDLTSAEKAQLPSDMKEEGIALAGKAVDFSGCTDPDSTSIFDKNSLLTKSTTTYAGGSKEDKCYTWNKGTPQEKTRLIEGTCKNKKFIYWYATCSDYLGKDYVCKGGKCVEYWEGLDEYFIKNKGELDCNNPENKNFCDEFNSAQKYYGFGTYELSLGDMVIIPPFIIKKSQEFWYGKYELKFHILWVDKTGTVNLIGTTYLNDAFQGIFTLSLGGSLITVTSNCTVLDAVCSGENCEKWCYTKPYSGEVTSKDKDVIGFADKTSKEYNTYFVKSMQICYDQVRSFLGIDTPFKKVYSRFISVNSGGGCYTGTAYIGCKATQETVGYFFNEWEDLSIIDNGGCVDYAAQPHELTHWITKWSLIDYDLVLNEGLADFVRFKVKDNTDPKIICKENSYEIGFDSYLYYNLSKNSVEEGQDIYRDKIYKTSACVWDHIDVTYGHDKFLEIMKKMDEVRFKPGTYNVFADIINPIVDKDILPELNEKFGLEEITITKEI